MNGILLIDKPKGWTSFDVVNYVRRMVQQSPLNTSHKKRFPVGHTGTLDPLATGLLVLLLGDYTKHAPALTKLGKTYEAVMRLGQTSTTGDDEGEKQLVSEHAPTQNDITTVLQEFVGDQLQTPPAFSAIKINGQRAYKMARAGQMPDLQPRPVHIASIQLTKYEYPFVYFTAEVSSGTYIRSLVEDIGTKLGTAAFMSDLRRMQVGQFSINDALTVSGLTAAQIVERLTKE